jgi:adenosylcobinamide-GDP ribazoletransferase
LLLADLLSAFMLLTRLPVARFTRFGGPPDLSRCVWAFPMVGLVVNGIGGLIYCLAHTLGMPPPLAAVWTLAATIILTGAFHEDGLADTADGFGGGTTPAHKMAIMRDSRIGSYGAVTLILSVAVRVAAIAVLNRSETVMLAMVAAGMLGRSGILLLPLVLAPARDSGMGAAMGKPGLASTAMALALATVAAFLSLHALPATAAVALGFGASLALAKLAHAQVGGHTGDVLGATEVVIECVVLTVIATAFSP